MFFTMNDNGSYSITTNGSRNDNNAFDALNKIFRFFNDDRTTIQIRTTKRAFLVNSKLINLN